MSRFRLGLILLLLPVFIRAAPAPAFANGADIGWLSQMEASGTQFRDSTGAQKDLLTILAEKGINSIRLRVWVNPSAGYCDKADVVKMAARVHRAGFRVMIDFHYSDTWADAGTQTKPAAWTGYTTAQLEQAMAAHTTDVLTALRDSGVTPDWVQVGNETNNGMLWEDGRATTNAANFAAMVSAGAAAVKGVDPNAMVVVHISNGYDNALFRWIFDLLKTNNAVWDAIGMSLYPSTTNWRSYDSLCLVNMKDMVSRYGSKVIVSEVGMSWDQPDTAFAMLKTLIANTKSVTGGLGVFYWEPEAYNGWQGYTLGAFDNSGKPTKALDAFLTGGPTSVANPMATAEPGDLAWHVTPSGVRIHSAAPVDWRLLDLEGRELDKGRITGDALVARNLPQGEWILSLRNAAGVRSVLIPRP